MTPETARRGEQSNTEERSGCVEMQT